MKYIGILLVVIVLVVGAFYLFRSPSPAVPSSTASTPRAGSHTITISGFAFQPAALTVARGSTVTWLNQDSVPHQIDGGTFKGSPITNGQSYSHTFSTAGTFDYHCAIHPFMTGTVTVQ